MTDKIKDYIKEKRDTLSKSSITTYASILKNLYRRIWGDDENDMSKFNDTKTVLDFLKDLPPNKRKTTLSALVIITDKKAYRDLMLEDVRDYNKEISKQKKSDSQEDNWISKDMINNLIKEQKQNATFLYKKSQLAPADLQQIQGYIILSLLGGSHIPPRRSKDFTDFKIRNIEKDKDNYIEKGKMVFNSYKTAKTYGRQEVDIPTALKTILNKWIKVNPTDYLLFDTNYKPLSSVKLNQRLNKLFYGKKISVNMLRHIFLTDEFGDTIAQKKKVANTMEDMGSSPAMLSTYVKND
jgi:site-specific recombinase XerD